MGCLSRWRFEVMEALSSEKQVWLQLRGSIPGVAPRRGINMPAWGNAPGPCFHNYSPALKGRNNVRSRCSTLDYSNSKLTQGVALGWHVAAPSGRLMGRSMTLRLPMA